MNERTSGVLITSLCWSLAGILSFVPIASAQQVLELRPNVQPLPASDLTLVRNVQGGFELRFSATSWNDGDGPLELIAGETGPAGQNVYQRIYLSDGGHL